MPDRDRFLLEDIRRHATECLSYLDGLTKADFLEDRRLQLVTERLLGIVGEAAGALSDGAREGIPYDWRAVRGLRNILAHQYGAVEAERVWGVCRKRLPQLLELVERALDRRP